MSDRDPASLADKRQIVLGAIAAAGTLSPTNPAAWIVKVNDAIPHVAAMLAADSKQVERAGEVADADLFVAAYQGCRLEESSQRLVVRLQPERASADPEDIRTHRVDSKLGQTMQSRLNTLKVGQRLLVYKAIEKQANNPNKTSRVLVHFQTLYTPPEDLKSPQDPSGTPIPDERPASSASPPAGTGGEATSPAAERFGALSTDVKLAVVKRLRKAGISFPEPDAADVDQFMQIINEEEATQ